MIQMQRFRRELLVFLSAKRSFERDDLVMIMGGRRGSLDFATLNLSGTAVDH